MTDNQKILPPLSVRISKAWNSIAREVSDPLYGQHGLIDNIREGYEAHTWEMQEEMIKNSIKQGNARWKYAGTTGIFLNDTENVIALALTNEDQKYLHARTNNDRELIASLPGRMHRDIRSDIQEHTEISLHNLSGGWIESHTSLIGNNKIILSNKSIDYGRADHKCVADIINGYNLGVYAEERK